MFSYGQGPSLVSLQDPSPAGAVCFRAEVHGTVAASVKNPGTLTLKGTLSPEPKESPKAFLKVMLVSEANVLTARP